MDSWQTAVLQLRNSLTEEETKLFLNSGPEDILRDIASLAEKRKSSKLRQVSEKIQPVLDAMKDYGTALDVISNSASILPLLWGALRVVLRVAQNYNEYYPKLLEMLAHIEDVLPRYSTYSNLFSTHEPLQDALLLAHFQIILFISRAKAIFVKSPWRVLVRVPWKSFDREFQTIIGQLRFCRVRVEEEAKFASMIESTKEIGRAQAERVLAAESRKKVDELKSSIERREEVEARRWLNARECPNERANVTRNRLSGSCEWILRQQKLSNWIKNDGVQIFWLFGVPGSGKSILYTKLLDYLETSNRLTYFFFCGADKERITLSSLIRTWIFQLIGHFPYAIKHLEIIRDASINPKATSREVSKLFRLLLEHLPACFLTVDGLDECPDREQFFQCLSRIPKRFKILITSRGADDIRKGISQTHMQSEYLQILPDMTATDMDLYITRCLSSQNPPYGPHISEKIRERLSECNGMFLWVKLMFEHLQSQTCEFEILQCLDELPTDLHEIYENILKQINGLPRPQRILAHKVFFWVITVRRPVSLAEMCGLLVIRPKSNEFDESRLVRSPDSTILSACGGLIQFRYPEKKVFPVHFTVTQYLQHYLSRSETLQELMAWYDARELRFGKSLAAAVCIRYLCLEFIGTLETPRSGHEISRVLNNNEPRFALLSYCVSNWFHHLRKIECPEPLVVEIAGRFLDPKFPNIGVCWHIYRLSSLDSIESAAYPSKLSSLHVAAPSGLQSIVERLLNIKDCSLADGSGRPSLCWAASRCYAKVLVETGFDRDMPPDKRSTAVVHGAAAAGHSDVLKI